LGVRLGKRGTDWLAARGIARIAVGVGVDDIQDGERETRSTSSRDVEARHTARAEEDAVPLERRANALQRNAL
jgi:hypothetical protein